jgi:hypothetical protein
VTSGEQDEFVSTVRADVRREAGTGTAVVSACHDGNTVIHAILPAKAPRVKADCGGRGPHKVDGGGGFAKAGVTVAARRKSWFLQVACGAAQP